MVRDVVLIQPVRRLEDNLGMMTGMLKPVSDDLNLPSSIRQPPQTITRHINRIALSVETFVSDETLPLSVKQSFRDAPVFPDFPAGIRWAFVAQRLKVAADQIQPGK